MMVHKLAKIAVWWIFWHGAPAPLDDGGWNGRIVTQQCFHMGARPHSDAPGDAAVTLQWSYCTPW